MDWDNKEFVMENLKTGGWNLKYVSDRLRNDPEVVMEAIKSYELAFEYASDRLKNDKDFVMKVLEIEGSLLLNASKELQKDKELILKAFKTENNMFIRTGEMCDYSDSIIENLPDYEKLREDKEIALGLVKSYGRKIKYLPEKLQKDKDIILTAVKTYASILFNENIDYGKEFAKECAKINGDVYPFLKSEYKKDIEIVEEVIKNNGEVLKYLPDEIKDNKKIVLKALAKRNYSFKIYFRKIKR